MATSPSTARFSSAKCARRCAAARATAGANGANGDGRDGAETSGTTNASGDASATTDVARDADASSGDADVGDGATATEATGEGEMGRETSAPADANALAPSAASGASASGKKTKSAGGKKKRSGAKKKKATVGQRSGGAGTAMEVDMTVVGAAGAALAVVGYFAWTKLKGGGGKASSPGDRGAFDGGMPSMGATSDDVPVASGVGEDGMDGPVSVAPKQQQQQKKIITREAKRMLRDVMDELRRVQTVDASGKNLGDEGTCFIAEAFAYNNVAT